MARGKKHKGVKDPYEQQRRREAKKNKTANRPPEHIDFSQEQPRKLRELFERAKKFEYVRKKRGGKKAKKKAENGTLIDTSKFNVRDEPLRGVKRYARPAPVFKQREGEGDHLFMMRVERECSTLVNQSKFEDKFGVEIHEDSVTGELEVVKRKKGEADEIIERSNPKRRKKLEEREKRKQLKKEKLKAKKKKKGAKGVVDEFERFKDEVKFGEVVHGPPQLLSRPRKTLEVDSRPGRKPLLLKSLMTGSPEKKRTSVFDSPLIHKQKKAKTRLLAGEKRQLEAERQRVVDAYRLMKARKSNGLQIGSS